MFDSLLAIAKDTAFHQPTSNSKDDDDKELLNSHVSVIENMHYYRQTVDDYGNSALMNCKAKAQALYLEHLGLYIKQVIRRPLGRLLVSLLYVNANFRTFCKA
jgi:exocyst complex component 1